MIDDGVLELEGLAAWKCRSDGFQPSHAASKLRE